MAEVDSLKQNINKIKQTNGSAFLYIPDSEKTEAMCRLAVELNPKLIECVPLAYLPSVVSGEDFINEVVSRKLRVAEAECRLFSAIGVKVNEEEYKKAELEALSKYMEKSPLVEEILDNAAKDDKPGRGSR